MSAHIKVLMGGRAAEDLVFHTTTTGAGNDLARATDMARKMVSRMGHVGRAFGPVAFNSADDASSDNGQAKGFSDGTALEIDSEIRTIVTACYDEVLDLLRVNMPAMEALVSGLLAKETLDSSEIEAILEPAASMKN